MYHTTGFSSDEISILCALIVEKSSDPLARRGRKPTLGLFRSIVVTLSYLRRNHVQQELAEFHGTSQSTISRDDRPIRSAARRDPSRLGPHRGRPRPDRPVHHRRNPASVLVMGRSSRELLRQAPHHRPQRPGRLHPRRAACLGLRSHARKDPRHQSHPRIRVPRHHRCPLHLGDKGYIGPGNDHPAAQTTETRNASTAEAVQHRRQFDPLQDRTHHSQPKNLANTPHRLPSAPPNLP